MLELNVSAFLAQPLSPPRHCVSPLSEQSSGEPGDLYESRTVSVNHSRPGADSVRRAAASVRGGVAGARAPLLPCGPAAPREPNRVALDALDLV